MYARDVMQALSRYQAHSLPTSLFRRRPAIGEPRTTIVIDLRDEASQPTHYLLGEYPP